MKLWIACFFGREDSDVLDEVALLIAAPDLSECARVAEHHVAGNPVLLSAEYERWISSVFELPEQVASHQARVLFGPFTACGTSGLGETYWRRDEGDPFWVNITEMKTGKLMSDCIYDDPRGWPHGPAAN